MNAQEANTFVNEGVPYFGNSMAGTQRINYQTSKNTHELPYQQYQYQHFPTWQSQQQFQNPEQAISAQYANYPNPYQVQPMMNVMMNQTNPQMAMNNQQMSVSQYQQGTQFIHPTFSGMDQQWMQERQSSKRYNEPKRGKSPEDIPEKKLWVAVSVLFGSISKELDIKLTSFNSMGSKLRVLKRDIMEQLHSINRIPSHSFNEYLENSKLFFLNQEVPNNTLLSQLLIHQNSFNICPVDLQLVLCKCKLKLTKRGYKTFPKIETLLSLNLEDLSKVEDFQISNEYGQIVWPGTTDLTYVDLDEVVNITQFEVEVYKGFSVQQKPQVGQKLNKSCFAEFKISYECLSREWGCKNTREMEYFLSKIFEEKQMMFINDDAQNGIVSLGKEIPHFSICDIVVKEN